ncbi:hypothetical protein [uncultured Chryseobacterium sp.]|jgi:hypothetical protein|uniref:hypothetical protein n=1 Tax=uncultured Chryseobacterium sp. TaxID=259322 RepID=UPI0026359253|nr:hypothetical protein [uncultured Chryseobacterium sp.]
MAVPLTTIFSWFENGDFPTEYQFQQTFSSFRHLDEKIKMNDVTGLLEAFQNTLSTGHLADENAHSSVLAKLDASNLTEVNINAWKEKLKFNLSATIDGEGEIGNVYTKEQIGQFMDMLQAVDSGMQESIDQIQQMLASDDVELDKLQEIVNYIKENRQQIELLKNSVTTSDDKINLVGSYSNWGSVIYQNQFNDVVFDKIRNIEDVVNPEKIKHEERVRGDSVVKHNLDTFSFVIDAYDIVTMFTIPLKVRRIDTNNIEVLFDSVPPNMIQLTIKKL